MNGVTLQLRMNQSGQCVLAILSLHAVVQAATVLVLLPDMQSTCRVKDVKILAWQAGEPGDATRKAE